MLDSSSDMAKRAVLVLAVLGLFGLPADAQTLLGGRVGLYTDSKDAFVGGEVLTPIGHSVYFNPNVEYVFVDRGASVTFNFDVHYDFARRANAFFWAGGGLAVLYFDPEGPAESSTEAGANLLFGVGFDAGGTVIPYVQAKVIAADDSDFVIAFGLRF